MLPGDCRTDTECYNGLRPFTMAINPHIVQNYAQGKKEEIFRLVCYSFQISFFLFVLLAYPVLLETELLLKLWLKQVPDYSVVFVRLVLIQMLIRDFAKSVAYLDACNR